MIAPANSSSLRTIALLLASLASINGVLLVASLDQLPLSIYFVVGLIANLIMAQVAMLTISFCCQWSNPVVRTLELLIGLLLAAWAASPAFDLKAPFDYTLPVATAICYLVGVFGWFAVQRRHGWQLLRVAAAERHVPPLAPDRFWQFSLRELLAVVALASVFMAAAARISQLPDAIQGLYSWYNRPAFWFGFFAVGGLAWIPITLAAVWAALLEQRPRRGWLTVAVTATLAGASFAIWLFLQPETGDVALRELLEAFGCSLASALIGAHIVFAWLLLARRLQFRFRKLSP